MSPSHKLPFNYFNEVISQNEFPTEWMDTWATEPSVNHETKAVANSKLGINECKTRIFISMHTDGASGCFANLFLSLDYKWDFFRSRMLSIHDDGLQCHR